jgi:hypothetical protein
MTVDPGPAKVCRVGSKLVFVIPEELIMAGVGTAEACKIVGTGRKSATGAHVARGHSRRSDPTVSRLVGFDQHRQPTPTSRHTYMNSRCAQSVLVDQMPGMLRPSNKCYTRRTNLAVISVDLDTVGMRDVLAGLRFPAPRWEVVAHAQNWGASHSCLAELTDLPARRYHSLRGVFHALQAQRDTSTAEF